MDRQQLKNEIKEELKQELKQEIMRDTNFIKIIAEELDEHKRDAQINLREIQRSL